MKRGAVLGIVIAALVLVVGGWLAWSFFTRPPGPDATAEAFLEALAAGDGAAAVDLMEAPRPDTDLAAAFAGAGSYLTDPAVEGVGAAEGGQTRADVTFTLDGEGRTTSFGLVEQEGRWLVAPDALGALTASTTLGDAVLVGGEPVTKDTEVALLPAVYPVDAAPAGIVSGSTTAVVLPGETTDAAVQASVSPEAEARAQEQLDGYAESCAEPADAVPAHCGLRIPWGADLATLDSLAFRVEQTPEVTLSDDLRTFAATGGVIVATATGTTRDGEQASFTYRADDWALRGTVSLTADGMQLAVD